MLEATDLFLGQSANGVRPIVADAGKVVGTARRAEKACWWWAGRTLFEVRETDDEPLLFTIRRRWGLWPRYDIRDAEGGHVGSLQGLELHDKNGCRVAHLLGRKGARLTHWQNTEGVVLAEIEEDRQNIHIHFVDIQDKNPFVRMLLLAAMLILQR